MSASKVTAFSCRHSLQKSSTSLHFLRQLHNGFSNSGLEHCLVMYNTVVYRERVVIRSQQHCTWQRRTRMTAEVMSLLHWSLPSLEVNLKMLYYPLINITVSCTYHQNKEMKAWDGRWREDQTYSCTIAVQCRCGITQITPGHSQYKNTLRSCDQSGGECPVIKVQWNLYKTDKTCIETKTTM